MDKQELINALDTLTVNFNPRDIEHLYALLYLMYCNYTALNNSDEKFTSNLLALIERCRLSEEDFNQPRPGDCPTCADGGERIRSVISPWATLLSLEETFLSPGVIRMFNNHRKY